MLIIAIDAKILFQSLIGTFRLTIAFRVISRSEVKLHVKRFAKGTEEMRDEFGTAIRSDMRRNAMLGKYMNNEEFGELSGSNGIVSRNKDSLFCKTVNDNEDAVESGR